MDIQYFDEPWRHAVIDNFLPDDLFNQILESQEEIYAISDEHFSPTSQTRIMLEHSSQKTNIVGEHILPNNSQQTKDVILSKFEMSGLRDLIDEFNHFLIENIDPVYENLKGESFPKEIKSNLYSGLQLQSPEFEYPIHDEVIVKVMSIVLFVSPEENHGTWLYERPDQDYYNPTKKVEWKQNRAFIFCGQPGVSWHSFNAKKGAWKRVTIASFFRLKGLEEWMELQKQEGNINQLLGSGNFDEYTKLKVELKENAQKELGLTNV